MKRRVGLSVLSLVALVIFANLIDLVLPEKRTPLLDAKLGWYEQHRDRIDTVFIGSSRVYRQIRPEIFDAEMARRGYQSYSFNMGLPSMKLPEIYHLLSVMLKPGRSNPERIFIAVESRTLVDVIESENAGTPRVVYWHDLRSTLFAIELLWEQNVTSQANLTLAQKLYATFEHLKTYLQRELNVSNATDFSRQFLAGRSKRVGWRVREEVARRRGFSPLKERGALLDRRNRFLRDVDLWRERVETKRNTYRRPSMAKLDFDVISSLGELSKRVRGIGSEPVFFVAPNPSVDSRWMQRLADESIITPVFMYDDPTRHPQFYRAEHYFDFGHLNGKGARLLTVRLVRDYVSWKESREER